MMRRMTRAFPVLIAGALLAPPAWAGDSAVRPSFPCPRLRSAPVIDGVPAPGEWAEAAAAPILGVIGAARTAWGPPRFWIGYGAKALFVAYRVPLPPGVSPKARATTHDGALWNDDAVEFFLEQRPGGGYWQFIGNAAGVRWESRGKDPKWNGAWRFAAKAQAGGWTCELRIPFAALGVSPPRPGEVWRFNAGVDRCAPVREHATWVPLGRTYHAPDRFAALRFLAAGNWVRLDRVGLDAGGRIAVQGSLRASGGSVSLAAAVESAGKVLGTYHKTAAAGPAVPFAWASRLPKTGIGPAPGRYRLRLRAGPGRATAARDGWLQTAPMFVVQPFIRLALHPFYLVEKRIVLDIATRRPPAGVGRFALDLEIRAADRPSNPLWRARLPGGRAAGKGITASLSVAVTKWPAGRYRVVARAIRLDRGTEFSRAELAFRKPPRPDWLGSKAGLEAGVLPPWPPLAVAGTSVRPWGRRYRLAPGPFPSAVVTRGQEVTDGPIRAVVDTGTGPEEIRGGRIEFLEKSPARVRFRCRARGAGVRFEEIGRVDFDGMLRYDFSLIPIRAGTRLRRFYVEIPLHAANARYLYYFPGHWRSAENAGALPAAGFHSRFKPFLWLGDEDRGFSWFCESARGWTPQDSERAIEILRPRPDRVVLRLNVIDKPERLTAPLRFTFGFQATPVKPVTRDVWDMRIVHSGNYGIERRPWHGSGRLIYPAAGNFNPKQGTLELWLRPGFDPNVKITDFAHRGRFNHDLFKALWPDGNMFCLYWNIDDRGLRVFVKRGSGYPLLLSTHEHWQAGELHHVALTWGSEVQVYVDGIRVGRRRFKGTLDQPLDGARLVFGGPSCEFSIDDLRISDIARAEFHPNAPARADRHTLLLDPLDDRFIPNGARPTRAVRCAGAPGGLADGACRFVPMKFGRGLRLYAPSNGKTYLDHLADLGVRTLVFHEHWTDIQNYPETRHEAALKSLVRACHAHGIRLLLYFGYEMSDIAPEYPVYGEECLASPRNRGYHRKPTQTAYTVCYRSPWQDFLAAGIAHVMDKYDIDGVYLDGTEYPHGCRNRHHGCGYLRPDGSIGITYPIFAVRRLMRRIYAIVISRKPNGLVNVHNSTCMTIPTLAWATSSWDGEQFGSMQGVFAEDILPLDAFRCEFMGRQWGVPAEFLCYNRPYTYHQALSFTLLHDVLVRGVADQEAPLWRAMAEFGRKQARFLPYWSNRDSFTRVSPPTVKVSVWSRGREGAMLVVSNLDRQARTVEVQPDLKRLGLAGGPIRAEDAIEGTPLPFRHGMLRLKLASLDWRLVHLAPGPG